jgi:L-cysteate sulfo-lyase
MEHDGPGDDPMMDFQAVKDRLGAWPRLQFGSYPTPLEPLTRLTKYLGGPQLWIKRDDIIGPGLGGNKARKLEYLMAEAVSLGKSKVVTYGGLQSNHVRMTAAVCAQLGLDAHIIHFASKPETLRGNQLLNQLFGARSHYVPFGGQSSGSQTIEATNRLVKAMSLLLVGRGAYFIPVGGHTLRGALGYVNAAIEIQEQMQVLQISNGQTNVVTAAGTGGTMAGLMAGFHLIGSQTQILGIDIGKLWKAFPASIAKLAGELCASLGQPHHFANDETPLIEEQYVGSSYSEPTAEGLSAMEMLARLEGIILDPVYTGKAFAGLIDMIRLGRFEKDENVVFLHTGGYPALFAEKKLLSL